MIGTDEHGNYETGKVVQTIGDWITYTLGTFPMEYEAEHSNARQFQPGQTVKVYQSGVVLPA